MPARGQVETFANLAVDVHGDGTGFGGGFEGEQSHGVDCDRKNACTSPTSRVIGSGGNESMKTLP
jgi:hypothetical protein